MLRNDAARKSQKTNQTSKQNLDQTKSEQNN